VLIGGFQHAAWTADAV